MTLETSPGMICYQRPSRNHRTTTTSQQLQITLHMLNFSVLINKSCSIHGMYRNHDGWICNTKSNRSEFLSGGRVIINPLLHMNIYNKISPYKTSFPVFNKCIESHAPAGWFSESWEYYQHQRLLISLCFYASWPEKDDKTHNV